MLNLRHLPVQSWLQHRFVSELDEIASECIALENQFTKRNCTLALAQLYFSLGEIDRAGYLLETAAGEDGGDAIPASVPSAGQRDHASEKPSPWELQQSRIHLQQAEVLLESGKLELAIDQLLEARTLLTTPHTPEEAVDFVSILWLALASKWTTAKPAHLAANWHVEALASLSKQLDDLLPGRQSDAWCYLRKVWYGLGMDDVELEQLLDDIVIPALADCGRWPGIQLRAWSAEALLAARRNSSERAMNALSKAEQTAIGPEVFCGFESAWAARGAALDWIERKSSALQQLYEKFYLLVRMEATSMLNMDEAAQQAKRDFLRDNGLTDPNADPSAVESRRNDDAFWAQHDPVVEEKYAGQWVVAFERRIVAHGADPDVVLEQAAGLTRRSKDELLVCAIAQPDDWLADA